MAVKKREQEYISQAVTTAIEAHSRVSVKIRDSFYTVEFSERREFPVDLIDERRIDYKKERELLWDEVHGQVDKQVEDILNLSKSK